MINIGKSILAAGFFLAPGGLQVASATLITHSPGNTTPGFNDGDILPAFIVGGAQGGQPAPFDTSYGTDIPLSGIFSQSRTFNYGAIADR